MPYATTEQEWKKQKELGDAVNSRAASWLIKQGWTVIKLWEGYELAFGPVPHKTIRIPDIFAVKDGVTSFYEVKAKKRFSWWKPPGEEGRWTTGIDIKHYNDYSMINDLFNIPVIMLFYHWSPDPSDKDLANGSDIECPTGLYKQHLSILRECVDHVYEDNMVFWREGVLTEVGTL